MNHEHTVATGRQHAADVVKAWAAVPGRAAIFDFNGTLSNDEPILERIFIELFAERLGWEMSAGEYRAEFLGHSDREIVEMAVERCGGGRHLVESLLERRRTEYQLTVAGASPISDATVALVRRMHEAGIPLAIVTGAQRVDVVNVVSSRGIDDCFRRIVAEEDVRAGKPDPEGFLTGAGLLEVEPEQVLVFEDSVPGVRAALRAGMSCVVVSDGTTDAALAIDPPAFVPELTPDLLVGIVS
ncbi:beta-phosphoglucomutase [Ilumatobacter fluminis]|uniref:Beta-phosphoglucomutase n=1 Tax=Ilumatobacter fluminis TaxID=467091 RepID=A0A4R7I017_9ACTN|nr:HAD family phosphatase [Ilumatobacter fluminis]TDT15876.1 beta-phosphoglucomutase [Ilumatobacter fluminis]